DRRDDPAEKAKPDHQLELTSLGHWGAVKTWELMQEFGIERASAGAFGPAGEARTWPGLWPTLDSALGWQDWPPNPKTLTNDQNVDAWRTLQLIVTPGNRQCVVHLPVAWFETFASERAVAARVAEPDAARFYATSIKALE